MGFVGEADVNGDAELLIASLINSIGGFFKRPPEPGNTIFRDTATDNDYGLFLSYIDTPYHLTHVQYSFIHVGVR